MVRGGRRAGRRGGVVECVGGGAGAVARRRGGARVRDVHVVGGRPLVRQRPLPLGREAWILRERHSVVDPDDAEPGFGREGTTALRPGDVVAVAADTEGDRSDAAHQDGGTEHGRQHR